MMAAAGSALAAQTAASLAAAALMVFAGLQKHRLEWRPRPSPFRMRRRSKR